MIDQLVMIDRYHHDYSTSMRPSLLLFLFIAMSLKSAFLHRAVCVQKCSRAVGEGFQYFAKQCWFTGATLLLTVNITGQWRFDWEMGITELHIKLQSKAYRGITYALAAWPQPHLFFFWSRRTRSLCSGALPQSGVATDDADCSVMLNR